MSARRLEAVVIGPGKPGLVRVALGRGDQQFVVDAPIELLQPSLALRVERDVRGILTASLPVDTAESWPDTLIRKGMFLGIHVQTRQRLNEVVKTGIPV